MNKSIDPKTLLPVFWLNVNEYAVSATDCFIKTVLGSCVGIIIFDQNKKIWGVNHFLNPQLGKALSEKFLNELKQLGAKNLKAYIYGGSNKESNTMGVGKGNIAFAENFCKNNNITILGYEVGGHHGRTVSVRLFKDGPDIQLKTHNQGSPKNNQDNIASEATKKMYEHMQKLMNKNNK